MSTDDLAISVRNLTKTYRLFGHPGDRVKQFLSLGFRKYHQEFTALRDVSFDIKKGETVGIIGRNGSGKSTLLQLICGILKPTSGTVQVNGRVSALLELGAGFNPEFTGRENVYFQGAIMGLSKEEMNERFDDIAAFADIGNFIDQPVRVYSSGMFLRLAFSVAIYVDPDILIVDEALAVGDSQFQAKCFNKLREFQQSGVTILFVSHDLDLIAAHCHRAVLMNGGELVQSTIPQEALDTYRRLLTTQHQGQLENILRVPVAAENLLWLGMFNTNPQEFRYGSQETEIIEAGIFNSAGNPTQLIQYGDECQIKIKLLIHKNNLQFFVSFVIKDLKGFPLCGTTTLMEDKHFDNIQRGQILMVVFQMPIYLNSGHYMLSVGSQAYGPDGNEVAHDHRTDYLPFEVTGKIRHGLFSVPITIWWENGW